MASARAFVLGCAVDRLDMEATVERCRELIESGGPAQHVVVNAAKLVLLRRDAELRRIVESCALVNADGQSVVWASHMLGDPLPERVAGIDLMERLLELAEQEAYRVFVLGARPEVLERAVERLRERYPHLVFAGWRDGYFADDERAEVCAEIRAARAHILLVAMPSPRKERFLALHLAELGVPLAMGVGGAIDVVAGVTRRAPRWLQGAGLEWLFRLAQEPRRLARRYVVTNTVFLVIVARELLARRRPPVEA